MKSDLDLFKLFRGKRKKEMESLIKKKAEIEFNRDFCSWLYRSGINSNKAYRISTKYIRPLYAEIVKDGIDPRIFFSKPIESNRKE